MRTYKGKVIPGRKVPIRPTAEKRMLRECMKLDRDECRGISCKECLFHNLETFKQWERDGRP